MKPVRERVWVLLVVMGGVLSACSSKYDNPQAAESIARQWVDSNLDTVAGQLAEVVGKDYSALAKPVISVLLKSGMQWQYKPMKLGRDHWQVTVSAKNSVDLSKIYVNKIANVSGAVDLDIDTANQLVKHYQVNTSASQVQFVPK